MRERERRESERRLGNLGAEKRSERLEGLRDAALRA